MVSIENILEHTYVAMNMWNGFIIMVSGPRQTVPGGEMTGPGVE